MLIEAKTIFQPFNTPLSLVTGVAATIACAVPYDALGTGFGTPPQVIIGRSTASPAVFGSDLGVGLRKIEIQANIGTPVAGSTIEMAFQIAQDTGAPGGYQPGPWQTVSTTGAQLAANLTAGVPLRMAWPVAFPEGFSPRFAQVVFITGGQITAGTISAAFVTMERDDYSVKYQPNNYDV